MLQKGSEHIFMSPTYMPCVPEDAKNYRLYGSKLTFSQAGC